MGAIPWFCGAVSATMVRKIARHICGRMTQYNYRGMLQEGLPSMTSGMQRDASSVIFQHDNDPKHTAKSVCAWLETQPFKVLSWPANSPDLNRMEHVWSQPKKLNRYEAPPDSMNTLNERTLREFDNIDLQFVKSLYESLPRQMWAVINSKERWTKY